MRRYNSNFFLAGVFFTALFSGLAGLGSLSADAQQTPDTLEQKMGAVFKGYDHADGPGLAALIVKDGKVIFKKGYGMANLEYDARITPTTVFDIASVSKQFTGFAISTLIQQGLLSPDDDVHKYLPDVPQFATPITIRNLIHHTSGLRDWPGGLTAAGWRWDESFAWEDIMRMVRQQKELDFPSGSEYQYSNTGYNLLAAIVAKVTGVSFPVWIDEHIFQPLGMHDSRVLANYAAVIPHVASSYYSSDGVYYKATDHLTAWGSSSIFTTVEDLAKWVIYFQHGLDIRDPVIMRMIQTDTLNNGSSNDYAYGLEVSSYRGQRNILHTGGWASFSTIISNYPDQHLAIILLSNRGDFDSWGRARQVAAFFIKGDGGAGASAGSVAIDYGKLPNVNVDTVLLHKYLGTYLLGPHWYVTFRLQNGRMVSQANGEGAFQAEMKSDTLMWVPAYNSTVAFLNVGDQAQAIRYHGHVSPRIQIVDTSAIRLNDYCGDFYSPELEITYHISNVDGGLRVHQMRLGDFRLEPDLTSKDGFNGQVGAMKFTRSGEVVDGFLLSQGRIRNVRFVKR